MRFGSTAVFSGASVGSVTDWNGDTDAFSEIEVVEGTDYSDTMTGSIGDQFLSDLAGDDTVSGGAGDDYFEDDIDTISIDSSLWGGGDVLKIAGIVSLLAQSQSSRLAGLFK